MSPTLSAPIEISITRTAKSRLPEIDFENVGFGSTFSDHLYCAWYRGGKWETPEIVPYGDLAFSPALSGLHYGQSIFEGMKAYRNLKGELVLFRKQEHLKRINKSAIRMCMPEIPSDIFFNGLETLLRLDKGWLAPEAGSQLYIRPIYFAADGLLGVRPSNDYCLLIFSSPVNAYYKEPVKVLVTEEQVRAEEGGVGFAKTAGNYARTMQMTRKAMQEGYSVVLWLDSRTRQNLEEFSTMNVFCVFANGEVATPTTQHGTILEGITRDSAIRLLREAGFTVNERDVAMEEVLTAARNGELKEVFGTGTAAVVSPVQSLTFRGETLQLPDPAGFEVCNFVRNTLADIRLGKVSDERDWVSVIC